MNPNLITIVAQLTLYSTENGGRKTGIRTGYRPNHVFEYLPNSTHFPTTYIGQIDFEEEEIRPGETAQVSVKFIRHQNIEELITVGRIWYIHEAQLKVGEANILEVLKPKNK